MEHIINYKPEFQQRAETFISTLMNAIEVEIPDSNGMTILPNILSMETFSEPSNIVVRNITDAFWTACIEKVSNPRTPRVTAVGNPGTGKSSSIPLLIRKLLKAGKTVVYQIASRREELFYYEFVPSVGDSVVTNLYPESLSPLEIESLWLDTTYFIIDPGKYTGSCDPCNDVSAKVIIVAYPDERLWGESQFEKERGGRSGDFTYYPLWSLEELLFAREAINSNMTVAEVHEGYRLFGGVPRHVFDPAGENLLRTQTNCINTLVLHETRYVTRGDVYATSRFIAGPHKSDILGFVQTNDTTYSTPTTDILSDHIAETIGVTHMTDIWKYKYEWRVPGNKIFKGYCRSLLLDKTNKRKKTKKGATEFRYRRVNELDDNENFSTIKLGGCKQVCLVSTDPIVEVMKPNSESSMVLFHTLDKSDHIIDFVYKDKKGRIHAFIATLGRNIDTLLLNMDDIIKLENKVGSKATKLSLYHMVPDDTFLTSTSSSIITRSNTDSTPDQRIKCNIWMVMVKPSHV